MSIADIEAELITKIREELDIYRNFSTIAEKLDHEGYLKFLVQSIDTVFINEIRFALQGMVSRSQQDKTNS